MRSETGSELLAVSARDLRKKYRLFSSPAERLREAFHPFRRQFHREFWALDGVSFDLRKGQTLGILGANGSGKSTLLQVIAGILHPTSGSVTVEGRVAALLELGAGFNPEFTGRDNVILNGAINGISGREMARRLPEIKEFADIGEFFDQPVKTYSSGMFIRVAFAVAINVDPDILIIDEALAVGDARFQNKCYDRLAGYQKEGKTIILVTHDTAAVANHCDRAIVMAHGKNAFDGAPVDAIDRYLNLLYSRGSSFLGIGAPVSAMGQSADARGHTDAESEFWDPNLRADHCSRHASYNPNEARLGNGSAEIIDYVLASDDGRDEQGFVSGCRLRLMVKVLAKQSCSRLAVGFAIKTVDGVEIYGTNTGSSFLNQPVRAEANTLHYFEFRFHQQLSPRNYFIDIGVAIDNDSLAGIILDVRRSVCHFVIQASGEPRFSGVVDLAPRFIHYAPKPANLV